MTKRVRVCAAGLVFFGLLVGGLIFCVLPSSWAGETPVIRLLISKDHIGGYQRSLFKHWIDADGDGCDTRKEVLIQEAVVKPKQGKYCKLSGGVWISTYDSISYKNDSFLDIDHMVPLAEAWRSGAAGWSGEKRQAYANDLQLQVALIAVTSRENRSKSDRDPAKWQPKVDKCGYIKSWVAVKGKYKLTVDELEATALKLAIATCNITGVYIKGKGEGGPAITPPVSTTSQPTRGSGSGSLLIRFFNCTGARAVQVTPIRRDTNPDLYALNTHLDGDKDGVACE